MNRLIFALTLDQLKAAVAEAAQRVIDLVCKHVDEKENPITQDELISRAAAQVEGAIRGKAKKEPRGRRGPWKKRATRRY